MYLGQSILSRKICYSSVDLSMIIDEGNYFNAQTSHGKTPRQTVVVEWLLCPLSHSIIGIFRLKIINIQKQPPHYSNNSSKAVFIYNFISAVDTDSSVQFLLIRVRFESLIPCQLSFSFWAKTSFSWSESGTQPRFLTLLGGLTLDVQACHYNVHQSGILLSYFETHPSENVWNDTTLDW